MANAANAAQHAGADATGAMVIPRVPWEKAARTSETIGKEVSSSIPIQSQSSTRNDFCTWTRILHHSGDIAFLALNSPFNGLFKSRTTRLLDRSEMA